MKKVLADNIMNMEDYLVTASARRKFSELMGMSIADLWRIHDNLVVQLKALID